MKMAWGRRSRYSRSSYVSGYRRGLINSLRGTDVNKSIFGETRALANPLQRKYRNAFGYRGNGLYGGQGKYTWSKFGRDLKKYGGIAANAALMASPLAPEYTMLKSMYKGRGLYGGQGEYKANALIDGGHHSMDIEAQNDETESITLCNTESVLEIFAPEILENYSSQFSLQSIDFNPGLYSLSRKLSAIAKNYVHYEIKQLVFEIRPLISESNVNNGITGTMMSAFLYDPQQSLPDSKDDMMDLSGAVSGRIVDHLKVGVECDPDKLKNTEYIVRTGPVPVGRDAGEYDHGRLIIATNNIPHDFSNKAIAELFVYYTVELRMWKPNRSHPLDYFVQTGDVAESATPGIINVDQMRSAQQNSLGGKLTGNVGTNVAHVIYTFPANYSGVVEICFNFHGSSLVRNTSCDTNVSGNVIQLKNQYGTNEDGPTNDGPMYQIVAATSSVFHYRSQFKVKSVTGNLNNEVVLTLSGSTTATGTIRTLQFQCREISDQLFESRTVPTPLFVNTQGIVSALA